MLEDVAAGQRDAVICWHIDRLHRQPIELEEFTKVCTSAGVSDVVTLHGDLDLASGDGLLMARVMAAVAANESDAKSRRSRRKMQEIAERGLPHGGGRRPYGFGPDRIAHDPVEAGVIRDAAARVLAGESLTSLCRSLDEAGTKTVTGSDWTPVTLRGLLLAPRIAGLREYRGQVIGPGAWEPIISPEDGERLRILLTDPARRTNRGARRYLLSGLCRCGRCGATMWTGKAHDRRAYTCKSGPGFTGCGRMSITAPALEQVITEAVLQRLDSAELANLLAGRSIDDDTDTAGLHEQIAADTARLDELATMWADGQVTGPEWRVARDRIDARLTANRRVLATRRGYRDVLAVACQGSNLREQWESLPLSRQVAIIKTVVDHVLVKPATTRGRHFDLQRVEPVWRV